MRDLLYCILVDLYASREFQALGEQIKYQGKFVCGEAASGRFWIRLDGNPVGSQCGEEGGVYQIDKSWVSNHPGGSLQGACGTVVTDWGNIGGGSHSTHVDNLKAQRDLGSSATYKGPLDCNA